MRDVADIRRIEELEAEVDRLSAVALMLQAKDSVHTLLRPHGFDRRGCRVLVMLARRSPGLMTKRMILAGLDRGADTNLKSVDVILCKLRKVIVDREIPGNIETVWNEGYRLDPRLTSWVLNVIRPVVDDEPSLFSGDPS